MKIVKPRAMPEGLRKFLVVTGKILKAVLEIVGFLAAIKTLLG